MFDDTTINGWLRQPGPINLRQSERTPVPQDGQGIVTAAVIGFAVIVWLYVGLRWFV